MNLRKREEVEEDGEEVDEEEVEAEDEVEEGAKVEREEKDSTKMLLSRLSDNFVHLH